MEGMSSENSGSTGATTAGDDSSSLGGFVTLAARSEGHVRNSLRLLRLVEPQDSQQLRRAASGGIQERPMPSPSFAREEVGVESARQVLASIRELLVQEQLLYSEVEFLLFKRIHSPERSAFLIKSFHPGLDLRGILQAYQIAYDVQLPDDS